MDVSGDFWHSRIYNHYPLIKEGNKIHKSLITDVHNQVFISNLLLSHLESRNVQFWGENIIESDC